jgi:hypothetical protein
VSTKKYTPKKKKTVTQRRIGKWTDQSFFKGRSPNGQKKTQNKTKTHMKKCSPSLAIKEI